MRKKLNFAFLGCGRIAVKHAETILNHLKDEANLVSVCDIKIDRAQNFGTKYNIPWFTNVDEMLNTLSTEIDVISVLTESGSHAKNVINLAKYKKHLIVEKPMALKLSDADLMIDACKKSKIKLFVVKQNRYNLPVAAVKKFVEAKKFGKLVLATVRVRWTRTQEYYDQDLWRGTWLMDGGVFANQASHHLDILEWMVGEPETVFAKSSTSLVDIETEDTGVAIIKFKNGCLGIIEATTAARPKDLEGSFSLLGENGSVEIGGFALNKMNHCNLKQINSSDKIDLSQYNQNPPDVYGFGHIEYLREVVDSIINFKKEPIDGYEGKKSLKLISAIYESIETNSEVNLDEEFKSLKLGKK